MYDNILDELQKEISLITSNNVPLTYMFDVYTPSYDMSGDGFVEVSLIRSHHQIDGLPLAKIRTKKAFGHLSSEEQKDVIRQTISNVLNTLSPKS
jgi:hypothetical protein